MKLIGKFLALGVFAAATTLAAHATPITGSISGNDDLSTFNNSAGTLMFGATGSVSSAPTGSSFTPYFTNGAAMTFNTQTFFYSTTQGGTLTLPGSTPTSGGVEVFQITEAGETLTFYVTSDTTMAIYGTPTSTPEGILLQGSGYFTETGNGTTFTTSAAAFTLSGSTVDGSVFTFGGTAATLPPTPEPSSLVLLGTGLMSAAGMVFRKRRSIA